MSLTSYRAAPPRDELDWRLAGACACCVCVRRAGRVVWADWRTWRRPTLPCLEAQYHGRWGFSRPSSGWDRVRAPRQSHQVVQSALSSGVSHQGSVLGRQFSRGRCLWRRRSPNAGLRYCSQTLRAGRRQVPVRRVMCVSLRLISMHGVPAIGWSVPFLTTDA
jgi:hypothetical protein